ncbi:uncharacterized protein LOC114531434 [Dendronephthya gigantea]|uniref:uncharacterized protein LOC114531434 n=1 Tax=Dendronephthya gigantea TaxID=151771 RepID=UPI00106BE902|nr:uncharacterized protein LOC114531434 [Dendronephthya gigantea]
MRTTRSPSVSSETSLSLSPTSNPTTQPHSTSPNLLEMFMIQSQQRMEIEAKRADMFQNTLLAMMSSNVRLPVQEPSGSVPIKPTEKTAIQQLTEENVSRVLKKIGLERYCQCFLDNHVDGILLEAMIHHTLGNGLLASLGVIDENDRSLLVREIYKVKFQGYED